MELRAFEPSDWASGRMAPSAQRGANAATEPVANTCSNVLQSELAAPVTPAASSTESATLRFVPASDTAPSASGGGRRENGAIESVKNSRESGLKQSKQTETART